MDISKRILEVREGRNVTQTELARKLEMEQSNYSRLEKRGEKLTLEQIDRIAKALDVTMLELLGGSNFDNELLSLREQITVLEKENNDLKDKIAIYQPLFKMVEFMISNPALVESFSKRMEEDKVSKKDVEETFAPLKEAYEKPLNQPTKGQKAKGDK